MPKITKFSWIQCNRNTRRNLVNLSRITKNGLVYLNNWWKKCNVLARKSKAQKRYSYQFWKKSSLCIKFSDKSKFCSSNLYLITLVIVKRKCASKWILEASLRSSLGLRSIFLCKKEIWTYFTIFYVRWILEDSLLLWRKQTYSSLSNTILACLPLYLV